MERQNEYLLDRKEQEIRRLTVEISELRDTIFRKDKGLIDLRLRNESTERIAGFLGVCTVLMGLVAVIAVTWALQVKP